MTDRNPTPDLALEAPPSQLPHQELSRLMCEAHEAIVYVDQQIVVRYCNDVYLQSVGLEQQQVIGRRPYDYSPQFGRSIFHEMLERCHYHREPQASIGYSAVLNSWLMVRAIPVDTGTLMIASQATDSLVSQYQLAQQALSDPLTNLRNKLALGQDVESLLKSNKQFTLGILGLNRFKTVNHSLGFAKGDLVLQAIASRLASNVSSTERVYRLNGDEFSVITERSPEEAVELLNSLRMLTLEPVELGRQTFVLGSSIGSVHAPEFGADAEILLRRAALAMREAKRFKRDTVVVYEDSLEKVVSARVALEHEFRHALDEGEFMLVLQPKGCLTQKHVVGAEGLIRWRHPTRGMVSPGEFLPLAQECSLMRRVDEWVIKEAANHITALKAAGYTMPISVNVSVDSLSDTALVETVQEVLERSGVDPNLLEIEIPEGALMHDVAISAQVLAGLFELGVQISIDDFGTGYSSFAYLARFPVNTLKVDRSFVNDMSHNEASRVIVRGLIRLAHSLQLRVVAEGAETESQITMLRKMKCDEVQGFGYAKPMPFEQFKEFLAANSKPQGPSAFTV